MGNLDRMFGGGVGDEEIVGAVAAPSAGGNPYAPQGVRQVPKATLRRTTIGVDSVATVAAAASVSIVLTPQVIFRPERFIVSGGIAPFFIINDIKIGNESMFPSADAVPAEVYIAAATDSQLAFKTCQVGQKITVTVTNIDPAAAAHRFTAAFNGSTAQ